MERTSGKQMKRGLIVKGTIGLAIGVVAYIVVSKFQMTGAGDMTANDNINAAIDASQSQLAITQEQTGGNVGGIGGSSTSNTVSSSSGAASARSYAYKNGTYSSAGSYDSPAGPESITVTLTLKDDIVASANVVPDASDPESSHYQGIFVANYTKYVVGKDISTLNLTKVSGSSLTPKGFDNALARIKAQAKV